MEFKQFWTAMVINKMTFISTFQRNPTLWTYHGTLNVLLFSPSEMPNWNKISTFYIANVVKTWAMSNVVDWTSTAWSILQGLKIINVLCCGCRVLWCMDNEPWRRRGACLGPVHTETFSCVFVLFWGLKVSISKSTYPFYFISTNLLCII